MHSFTKSFGLLLVAAALALAVLTTTREPVSAATTASSAQVDCGTIDLGSAQNSAAAAAFGCFTKAYAHCDFASLTATDPSSQGPTTSTFIIYPGDSGCNISETITGQAANDATALTYVCSKVSQDGNALHFTGCGTQRDVWLRTQGG
jgi:hypothetical protein